MSTASAMGICIDALVSTFTAALSADQVFDGPAIGEAELDSYVLVGLTDPDSEMLDQAASSVQDWAWLGHVQRGEKIVIHCCAVGWNGDANMQTARNAALAIMQVATTAIEANPDFAQGQILWVTGLTSNSLRQSQSNTGATAVLHFDVAFEARLS